MTKAQCLGLFIRRSVSELCDTYERELMAAVRPDKVRTRSLDSAISTLVDEAIQCFMDNEDLFDDLDDSNEVRTVAVHYFDVRVRMLSADSYVLLLDKLFLQEWKGRTYLHNYALRQGQIVLDF